MKVGEAPPGFTSGVTPKGQPGEWKIIEAPAPTAFAPLSPLARTRNTRPVLAQIARDPTDEHFPFLVYDGEEFGDFHFTTKFRCQDGKVEQMAGVVFRYQDPLNYYVVRASALGDTFKFYKFVEGFRSQPIGRSLKIPKGRWGELTVVCKDNKIVVLLNGKVAIPELVDNSFRVGKVGFWTKSDSVSYFTDARVKYTPRVPLAQKMIQQMVDDSKTLVAMTIMAYDATRKELRVIAATEEADRNKSATENEIKYFNTDEMFYRKEKNRRVTLYIPLHDRNGDAVALLKVFGKTFFGETKQTTITRALKIQSEMEKRFTDASQLTE